MGLSSSDDRMASVREPSVRDSFGPPCLSRRLSRDAFTSEDFRGEKVENDCNSGDCLVEW